MNSNSPLNTGPRLNPFAAAIIGCGNIHGVHTEAISALPGVYLHAVADLNAQKAHITAEQHHCKAFADYMEMLDDPRVDVVHICTPHYLHAEMAIAAMEHGKHVLVEKPVAIHPTDAQRMVEISRKTGKMLGVCFQNRYNATSRKMKDLIDSGRVGAVKGGRAFVTWHRDGVYYKSGSWRGTWAQEGGGVLINQAIHTLDLLHWLIGEAEEIQGSVHTRLLSDCIEVEDTAEAVIRFKGGAVGIFYATNCYVTDSSVQLEIICEKAVLRLGEGLTIQYRDGTIEKVTETDSETGHKAYWGCGHRELIRDFYRRLASGESFPIDGMEGLKTLQWVQGIYASSRENRPVRME